MATNFPSGLDSLTNPTSSDSLNSPSHADQHANVNDAVEALEAKVGVDGSAVTGSLDYKVTASKTVTDKIDPAGASTDQVLKWNGTKFVPATGSSLSTSDSPPGSPTAGMLWYESDTGRTFIYYDSAWVEIGSTATTNVNANDLSGTTLASNVVSSSLTSVGTITNLQATAATINGWTVSQPGLVLVTSQAVGSAVSSVTVSNAFSSTYDNYRITWTGGTISASALVSVWLGTLGGTGYSGGRASVTIAGVANGNGDNNNTNWSYAGVGGTNGSNMAFDLYNPNKTTRTYIHSQYFEFLSTTAFGTYAGILDNNTSYTSVTFQPSGGATMTGGTIRVYGYRNS